MRSIIALALLALAACTPADADTRPGLRSINVTATPVPLDAADPARDRVGKLRYLGGLVVSSNDPRFGGLSALRMMAPARLLSVTDGGQWVALDLDEKGDRLVGLKGAAVDIVRGPQREPLKGKAHVDAESLEITPQGIAVGFEREHRIWHYRTLGAPARAEPFADQRWLSSLPLNDGIEAMAKIGSAWLYIAEARLADGRHEGILLSPAGLNRNYARVTVDVPAPYNPTDAHAYGDDQLIILGRRFSPLAGVGAILLRAPVDLKTMKVGKSEVLAELAPPLTVDNMEGLAVVRERGRTFVYMASDDNFSPLQRTLILKFELLP
ncbi:esterase-like activity of phytase family protein [Sphingoaurantiacus capsulatus]|uniref:Esterase-like activity of phytase family protein n=1 Tax=Sphingoaurantiacus capsulatus TaxID=1771310 RepID=A0ABV7XAE9_9SPHN